VEDGGMINNGKPYTKGQMARINAGAWGDFYMRQAIVKIAKVVAVGLNTPGVTWFTLDANL
jgi:hypothetical protein